MNLGTGAQFSWSNNEMKWWCESEPMRSENQPNSCTDRNRSTGTWLVLAAALLCLGPDYLSALLDYHPELGTRYSLPDARHNRLTDNSSEARAAWQAREDAWLAELSVRGRPAEVGSRDWVTYGILNEALASSAAIRVCPSRSPICAAAWDPATERHA